MVASSSWCWSKKLSKPLGIGIDFTSSSGVPLAMILRFFSSSFFCSADTSMSSRWKASASRWAVFVASALASSVVPTGLAIMACQSVRKG